MEKFLKRISSRKFLAVFFAEVAALVSLLWPHGESMLLEGSQRVAAIITMALAALGYGLIEASLDRDPDVTRPDE